MRQDKEFTLPAGAEVSIIPVMQGEGLLKIDDSELPEILPVLALRNAVLFPGAVFPITIGREKSVHLIQDAEKEGFFIGAVPQNDVMVEEPQEEDLSRYGSVCKVLKTLEMPDGTITAILQAFKRLSMDAVLGYEPYITARVHYLPDILLEDPKGTDIKAISESLKDKSIHLLRASNIGTRETVGALKAIDDFRFLVNFIATTVEVENFESKIQLLEIDNIKTRALKLLSVLDAQVELMKIKQEINQKVKSEIDQQQREYYLNNQLRTIQEELGMDDSEEFDKFRERAAAKKWPKEIGEAFAKELAKLEKYNPSSPDYSVQYNYLEFMLDLPWGEMSRDNLDLKHAQKVLDGDHYGLDTVKDRIIEYLAVLKLKGNMKSPILCLYGPPGVGKTSLGKSVAKRSAASTCASPWAACTTRRSCAATARPTWAPSRAVS
jgi:ATP-dependent Lon protease, bacterial type